MTHRYGRCGFLEHDTPLDRGLGYMNCNPPGVGRLIRAELANGPRPHSWLDFEVLQPTRIGINPCNSPYFPHAGSRRNPTFSIVQHRLLSRLLLGSIVNEFSLLLVRHGSSHNSPHTHCNRNICVRRVCALLSKPYPLYFTGMAKVRTWETLRQKLPRG